MATLPSAAPPSGVSAAAVAAAAIVDGDAISKHSCHDSGIDIRDPLPTVQPIATKKNYSDADIVLSSEWVPPLTIAPTVYTDTLSAQSAQLSAQSHNLEAGGRKKTSSVSFSVDDGGASEASGSNSSASGPTVADKTSTEKKNKMLKRLSYPLTWVEGFTGDGKPNITTSESVDSAPNTGDSNQSVFSKVFSR